MALVCFWFSICLDKLPTETYFCLFRKSVFITCVSGVLPEKSLFVQVPWSVSLRVSSSGFKFWFLLRFLMSPELYAEGEGKEASSVFPALGICVSQQHFLKRLSVHLWCMFLATCLGVNKLQKGGFLSFPSGVLSCVVLCWPVLFPASVVFLSQCFEIEYFEAFSFDILCQNWLGYSNSSVSFLCFSYMKILTDILV